MGVYRRTSHFFTPEGSFDNTADLGTDEKAAVFENRRRKESYITKKNPIRDLKMGGDIGGEAVNGGAIWGGGGGRL